MKDESLPDVENPLGGIPLRSEEIGFRPEELSKCPKCGRSNGIDRSNCLYCGAELQAIPGTADVPLGIRKLDDWEKGWNVIFLSAQSSDAMDEAATLLGVNSVLIRKIFDLQVPLPVARVGTEREASLVVERMEEMGFSTAVISDEELDLASPPFRLRGIERSHGVLLLRPFNGGRAIEIPAGDLALIVEGTIVEARSENVEQRRKRSNKTIFESASMTDESVIDIYSFTEPTGWRIQFGFDFSCLAEERSSLAAENVRKLALWLAERAPNATVIDGYRSCRRLLDEIWEIQVRKDSLGVQRSGFGRIEMNSATVTTNLRQFTKFSRLQWQILHGTAPKTAR